MVTQAPTRLNKGDRIINMYSILSLSACIKTAKTKTSVPINALTVQKNLRVLTDHLTVAFCNVRT